MLTSSSVVPVQTDVSSGEAKDEVREQVSESNDNKPKQFEDNAGDEQTKGDQSNDPENPTNSMNPNDSVSKENQEEKPTAKSVEEENASKVETSNVDKRTSGGETIAAEGEVKPGGQEDWGEGSAANKVDSNESNKKSDSAETEKKLDSNENGEKSDSSDENQKKVEEKQDQDESKQSSGEKKEDGDASKQASNEGLLSGAQADLLNETAIQNGSWSTQSSESKNEKEVQQTLESKQQKTQSWKICNVTAGQDYIPCLDNLKAIKKLRTTKHYEHRERHCPEVAPTCLVGLPKGYRRPVQWPNSRDKIWYTNVPHTQLVEFKGHQNWVKVSGEYLTFPGGGTQFQHGALHYIDFIEKTVPEIAWGSHTRVVLDVGCGVASFGGYLFEKNVITMSFAPKDEHEAQVQFALERGIPAISAVMGTKRLPYPGGVFDALHCARCRVPWHIEGGKLLLELNRVLRPGGFFVWSATPVYQKEDEDVEIWKAMEKLRKSICWKLLVIKNDKLNGVGAAVYKKPADNNCYEKRSQSEPPICQESDDPNAAWNVSLQSCIHKVPAAASERGFQWPVQWPARLEKPPYWLTSSQVGVYGKSAPEDFTSDYAHWKHVVSKSYLNGMGISWSNVRNVMDMRSVYGGFAAALRDLQLWVMNVVTVDSPDTLPIIYERGLFGIYHDWCESFSSYPRTYDLLHADHLFSKIKKKCNLVALVAEADRLLRPEGKLIVRDTVEIISEVQNLLKSMHWEIRLSFSKDKEGILCVQKTKWRPSELEAIDG